MLSNKRYHLFFLRNYNSLYINFWRFKNMRGEKKNEVDKIIIVPWEKSYVREKRSDTKDELAMDDINTDFLILQEYEEGVTEYGMIVKDEKGLPLILSDFKYFNEFRENYSEKK